MIYLQCKNFQKILKQIKINAVNVILFVWILFFLSQNDQVLHNYGKHVWGEMFGKDG